MIRYVVIIFGINCNIKLIANFLTGIIVMIFSLMCIQTAVIIKRTDSIKFITTEVIFNIIRFKSDIVCNFKTKLN